MGASQDGYLLSGLTFNKYGDRSNAIGKRFGRLKQSLGFSEKKVFHSIRKTVVTLLEDGGHHSSSNTPTRADATVTRADAWRCMALHGVATA